MYKHGLIHMFHGLASKENVYILIVATASYIYITSRKLMKHIIQNMNLLLMLKMKR